MVNLSSIVKYADQLLDTAGTPDAPNALNGIQLENRNPIRGVAAAVDFSTRAISGTIERGANLLIVHHGMFWSGLESLSQSAYRRLQALIESDIAVYSSHLPLDRHPTLGNNVLLAKSLGLKPTGQFARVGEIFIGVSGDSDIATYTIAERSREFARQYGGTIRTTRISKERKTKKWAMCSGAGASLETLREAITIGVDTLIVGEGPHWTAVFAEEHELAIIYAGHYATETLGVCALAEHLGQKFNLPWSFVSAPTGL